MAANTIRPSDAPRRANVPRPAPDAVPQPAAAPAPEPVVQRHTSPDFKEGTAAATPADARPVGEEAEAAPAKKAPRSSWSLFSMLDRITSMDGLFREGLPVRYLPKLLFVMLLTLLYIGNTHYGNRMNRNIQRLKQETEDLRADYTTLKSDYMEASKQSEVARKVAAFGLVESSSPPFRITVPAGHLDAAALELLPVLTADTLAARAARDSVAAHMADSLAGRQRRYANADGSEDSGPEIIAPPQDLGGDTTAAALAVSRAARLTGNSAAAKAKKATPAAKKRPAGTPASKKVKKPAKSVDKVAKHTVQKSTSQHKKKGQVGKPARTGKRATHPAH